jgi:hypothetical protein
MVVPLAIALAAGCKKEGGESDGMYAQKNEPDNLAGLLDMIARSAETGDAKKAGALTRSLIPDQAAYRKAFREDVPPAVLGRFVEAARQVPQDDAQLAGLIHRGDPTQTQVSVHAATPEEIQAGSTPAAAEFPAGVKDNAGLLRPGLRFYEAEFVAPGEELGMKYHLLFWDGSRWRMLGPIWRMLETPGG